MKRRLPLRSIPRLLFVVLLVAACTSRVFADGGRFRFREPAGPFIVTLFTSPDPLTMGRADFSVALERANTPGLLQDANITLVLTPSGRGRPLVLHASHSAATSKWLQAANFSFPAQGRWMVAVVVRSGQEFGQCSGEVQVGSNGPRNLIWDLIPLPLAALLFVLHQRRKLIYNRDRIARSSVALSQIRFRSGKPAYNPEAKRALDGGPERT